MASPGSYKGVPITAGSDADIAAQLARIDSQQAPKPVNSIPAAELGKNTKTYSTYFPAPTASAGLAETATASKDAYLSSIAGETDTLVADQAAGKGAIQGLLGRLGMSAGKKADLYESSGLNSDRKAIDELTSQMEATGRNFDKQIETIQNTNPEGKLVSGVNIDINNLTRQKAATLADQAIVLNARTRNYDTAKSIIDTKADAETEDLRTQLQGLQFFYSENAQNLDTNKRTLLQEQIDAANREYQTAHDLRTQIGQVQLQAASNGAPVSVVSAIGRSGDWEGALRAAGGYLKAPKQAAAGMSYYKDDETRLIMRSGLSGASQSTKNAFLASPADFQDAFIRNGSGSAGASAENINHSLAEWNEYQARIKGGDDVAALVQALKQ